MLNYIGSTARSRERERQVLEQALDGAKTPTHFEGGRWAVLISLIALILSGFSLYETMLKQARVALHVGAVMHYARDPVGSVEVFAVPMTITNHGARDAIVPALDLRITQAKPGAATSASFASAYVGANPAKDKQPFTPLSIPGRGSYTGIVLFYPSDRQNDAHAAVVNGKETYRFCITARTEADHDYPLLDALLDSPPSALSFEAGLLWFSAPELHAGKTIPLQINNAKRHVPARGTSNVCD